MSVSHLMAVMFHLASFEGSDVKGQSSGRTRELT